ncbi:uncharacterized protein RAG0_03558 [Rhynchosporium agropyri]|uniref:Uncharacterized protein n=1 Tax=Rhynchosporium agropyri TaxID=914238 RepID=A0A1E1K972_9HELO|nr:uncharacterized protein RAG0_03558 [Rhynchosporium agropyri]
MEKQAWKATEKVKREGSERVERPGTDRQTDSSTMPGGSRIMTDGEPILREGIESLQGIHASNTHYQPSPLLPRCMKSVANDGMGLTERKKEGGRGQEAGVAIDGMGLMERKTFLSME